VPQTEQAACGSFGDLHWGQATVETAVAFQFARRDRVLLRDILRLGTATVLLLYRVLRAVRQSRRWRLSRFVHGVRRGRLR
jgi:hypothetical protein